MNGWRDIKFREGLLRPAVRGIGNNVNAGLLAGTIHFPIAYFLLNRILRRRGADNPERTAAALSGLGSAVVGAGAWWGTRNNSGRPYVDGDDFADTLLGGKNQGWFGGAYKKGSDLGFFDKGNLIQGIDEMDITNSQRDFLTEGISLAPGKYQTTLWGLGDGFSKAVDHNTGGLLGYATRALEGGLLGGAFSSMLGLSPQNAKWVAGVSAAADALQGSQLFNAIGQLL